MVSQASRCGSRENPCDDSFFSLSEMHHPTTYEYQTPALSSANTILFRTEEKQS